MTLSNLLALTLNYFIRYIGSCRLDACPRTPSPSPRFKLLRCRVIDAGILTTKTFLPLRWRSLSFY